MAKLMNRKGTLMVKAGLVMHVKVIDVKQAFGRVDVCVAPLVSNGGQGSAWVSADSVSWIIGDHK
jgi:hypothetical protein